MGFGSESRAQKVEQVGLHAAWPFTRKNHVNINNVFLHVKQMDTRHDSPRAFQLAPVLNGSPDFQQVFAS